jgi:hypothetical protein
MIVFSLQFFIHMASMIDDKVMSMSKISFENVRTFITFLLNILDIWSIKNIYMKLYVILKIYTIVYIIERILWIKFELFHLDKLSKKHEYQIWGFV